MLSIIHAFTIGTEQNFDGGNSGHGLKKNVTCKETFSLETQKQNLKYLVNVLFTACLFKLSTTRISFCDRLRLMSSCAGGLAPLRMKNVK